MKRRFLLLGVLSFLTLSSCNLIPGLGPTGKSSSSSPSSNSPSSQSNSGSKSSSKSTTTTTEEHEHTFSEEWSSDDTYHWHAATCGHNVRKDYEKHTWVSEMAPVDEWDSKGTLKNTCSVCQRTA